MGKILPLAFLSLPLCSALLAQSSLTLSSGQAAPSGAVSLNLALASPAGSEPAALQWTFSYPAASVTSFSVAAGPALTSATKTLACAGGPTGYTCVATGMNRSTIANGVVAVVSLTLCPFGTPVPIGVNGALGASLSGGAIGVSSTGGVVTPAPPVTIGGLSCSPGSLGPGAFVPCTLTLTGPGGGVTASLASNSANLTVPASLSIPAGSASATFSAVAAAFTFDQTVTVTATLNGSSASTTLSLVSLPAVASLQCAPVSLSANSRSSCTVTLSKAGPAGGVTVSVASSNPALVAPASVPVAAGSVSTGFTVTAGTFTTAQTAVLTAAAGSGSASVSISLTVGETSGTVMPLLQLHAEPSEVKGAANGAVVTPGVGPPGFTGALVVAGSGSVNFTPAVSGNGVYFLNCCDNTNRAYYKFTGTAVGSIFNVAQGQISFYLKSRYSFAQRQASAAQLRCAFDVRDNDINNHLFYFYTQPSSGYLMFSYRVGGAAQFYYVPKGTEDALFGSGVAVRVTMSWDGSVGKLYLNDVLVQSSSYTKPTPNWTALSNFDLGATEYQTFGGYNASDDVIDEFTVTGPAADTTPPKVSITAPAAGAPVSGTATVSANATDNVGVANVQFKLDGTNLGTAVTGAGPAYSVTWSTAGSANGPHTLTAVAVDAAGNSSTSGGIIITVTNDTTPPSVSITAPANGAAVSGTVTVTANATDNVEVAGVQFQLDGASLGSAVTAVGPAYSVVWDTSTAANGSHTLTAVATDAAGNSAASSVSVTVANPLLQLHADASEVSGITNGSIVTPPIAPAGFTGTVVAKGSGSVTFTPAEVGNGVYFQKCCDNTNTAYYKFTGATVGNIFNIAQGQVSFFLISRYSFAQRQASAASPRCIFDVRDGDVNNHLFYFLTETGGSYLMFSYRVGGAAQFYYVPQGTEDALFGSGSVLKVTITWDGSTSRLYFNDKLVQSAAYTKSVPNWTALSNFNLGAIEYLTYGGYNVNDDVIDEFTVAPLPGK